MDKMKLVNCVILLGYLTVIFFSRVNNKYPSLYNRCLLVEKNKIFVTILVGIKSFGEMFFSELIYRFPTNN